MATIFCFTSTGNSLYTAKKIAEKIEGKVLPMNNERVQTEDDIIGFVFPVYFWGLPRMVERFVTKMRISNKDAYVFTVVTSGGPGFGVLGELKSMLQAKGVCLRYGTRLISVSNYLPEFEAKDSEVIRRRVDKKLVKITDAISRQMSNRIQATTVINKMIYRVFPDEGSDQYFTVSSTCTGCTICKQVCPAKNIAMEDSGKPGFQHKCEHCLACIHNCPTHAIDWKQKTQGKKRYRNAGILLNDLILFNNMGENDV